MGGDILGWGNSNYKDMKGIRHMEVRNSKSFYFAGAYGWELESGMERNPADLVSNMNLMLVILIGSHWKDLCWGGTKSTLKKKD